MMGNEREKKHEQAREQEELQGKQLVDENEKVRWRSLPVRVASESVRLQWSYTGPFSQKAS